MAKPLKVDEVWLERIAELLNGLEFGSVSIEVHEGQIVQIERTERKRYDNKAAARTSSAGNAGRTSAESRGVNKA